jgi:hypothetical protein
VIPGVQKIMGRCFAHGQFLIVVGCEQTNKFKKIFILVHITPVMTILLNCDPLFSYPSDNHFKEEEIAISTLYLDAILYYT